MSEGNFNFSDFSPKELDFIKKTAEEIISLHTWGDYNGEVSYHGIKLAKAILAYLEWTPDE